MAHGVFNRDVLRIYVSDRDQTASLASLDTRQVFPKPRSILCHGSGAWLVENFGMHQWCHDSHVLIHFGALDDFRGTGTLSHSGWQALAQ